MWHVVLFDVLLGKQLLTEESTQKDNWQDEAMCGHGCGRYRWTFTNSCGPQPGHPTHTEHVQYTRCCSSTEATGVNVTQLLSGVGGGCERPGRTRLSPACLGKVGVEVQV